VYGGAVGAGIEHAGIDVVCVDYACPAALAVGGYAGVHIVPGVILVVVPRGRLDCVIGSLEIWHVWWRDREYKRILCVIGE
jgi:hypothetical protein